MRGSSRASPNCWPVGTAVKDLPLDEDVEHVTGTAPVAVETLAIFVRFWLATTPVLPEPAAQAARAKARERYDAFIAALGRRLANEPKLRQEISEDIISQSDQD